MLLLYLTGHILYCMICTSRWELLWRGDSVEVNGKLTVEGNYIANKERLAVCDGQIRVHGNVTIKKDASVAMDCEESDYFYAGGSSWERSCFSAERKDRK